jgi:hypothetical protein
MSAAMMIWFIEKNYKIIKRVYGFFWFYHAVTHDKTIYYGFCDKKEPSTTEVGRVVRRPGRVIDRLTSGMRECSEDKLQH